MASAEGVNSASHTSENSKERHSSEGDGSEKKNSETGSKGEANFECNICLDTAKDAVVSVCGHLFCWPCLHQWLETRPNAKTCPVCKAAISRDKVIPLYGRGADSSQDPRNKAPPRPPGQRTEPEPQHPFWFGDGGGANFQFHMGGGAFPFGFLTLFSHGLGDGNREIPAEQMRDDAFLSRVFLFLGILFVLWLAIA